MHVIVVLASIIFPSESNPEFFSSCFGFFFDILNYYHQIDVLSIQFAECMNILDKIFSLLRFFITAKFSFFYIHLLNIFHRNFPFFSNPFTITITIMMMIKILKNQTKKHHYYYHVKAAGNIIIIDDIRENKIPTVNLVKKNVQVNILDSLCVCDL